MNIYGTCTYCLDFYFNTMMLAFIDFIGKHRSNLYSQTLKASIRGCPTYLIHRGQLPRLEDNIFKINIP